MSFTTIEEYNNYLAEKKDNVDIIEYIKEINKLEYNIDISFIDEFIKLVDENICCIHPLMLQKYGISKPSQHNFINNKDYQLDKFDESPPSRGPYRHEFYIHPNIFKICLIRSQTTQVYVRYYILLEKSIKYYKEYRKKLSDKYVSELENKILQKDNIIDKLQEQIDLLKKNYENQTLVQYQYHDEHIDSTRKIVNFFCEHIDDIKEKLEETSNNIKLISKNLDIITENKICRNNEYLNIEYLIIVSSFIFILLYYTDINLKIIKNLYYNLIEQLYYILLFIYNLMNK